MKTSKALILLLLVFLVLSTIIIAKNHIMVFAANYLPLTAKGAIKAIIKGNGYEKVSNDYNSKFLPETQFTKLNFKKINLKMLARAEAGYFQKMVKKNNVGYKSFYIDVINKKTIVITDAMGNSYLIDNLSKKFNQNNFKPLKKNIKIFKVLDTFIHNNHIFISHIDQINDCRNFVISKAKINTKSLVYNEFFRDRKCAKFIQGGRMQRINYNNSSGLLFSIADNIADKPNNEPQSFNSNYGKIIYKDFAKKNSIIYSMGHRNPQGLLVFDNIVLSTEHGPRGGDEINKIMFGKNYGWPISSYGKKYGSTSEYKQSHFDQGFQEPIFAFVPSIGISEIIKVPNDFNKNWQNNFLVASLNKKCLFRIKFNKDYTKLIYIEEIFIGDRIRDIRFYKNKILLALEGKGQLGIISN